jgi:hypothetical protein
MWRKTPPSGDTGETELVEPAWIVSGDALRQDRLFPLNRRRFKAFKAA